ncbi:hypothetical protein [Argonema galeatum]|uniref:hypothetical protein n=1 Tax=Argonema galeatum TaxID=2942762 RepID=UPI00201173C1|nr:hypothetical protein [Argonema galeatum]MCL1467081.1 hypothetical protein [Argonema galeatum A003/A1]
MLGQYRAIPSKAGTVFVLNTKAKALSTWLYQYAYKSEIEVLAVNAKQSLTQLYRF